ncbi:hypothetical protein MRB53_026529 [Persea americana]|uniref:Uncharacterized protein n=1 Tax=Persea americana TaxID=3435 RepID=A0ACC2LJ96_PERAE|nr:hypothetical protein MRB53_026529 [Persea americana]|eukprot:TRINITY_DN27879_c0_g1_i1.p1 TRINITY_DN27879_c0_g1~~TRINITY_DN27879_c0_g1_i1.p1  ORF type:complete len:317 (+),score=101.32 TRINITY_DN27879_c0_g1_i1:205-1155(+)
MQGGSGVGGVASSGSSNHGSISTVSKAEVVLEQDYMGMSEVSSTSKLVEEEENEDGELELGLGLGWGTGGTKVNKPTTPWGEYCRILTAKDFPSLVSSSSPTVAGTKWAAEADSVGQEIGSNMPSNQAVGWPPVPAYRMNSLANQVKVPSEQNIVSSSNANKSFGKSNNMGETSKNNKIPEKGGHGLSKFVKVNMDGMQIGRKVDLNAHVCYETLAQALEDMFHRPTSMNTNNRPTGFQENEVTGAASKPSKLLDGSSEFVLTYEDREGDWMLVGDVPWGMFLHTARRLRIMKTSEANGLAPRFQEKRNKQRSKPI